MVLDWFERHGRRDLPWQHPRTPYRVWVSEVMLQQTQVVTVIPYFERFLARFPEIPALATAPLDEVLAHWSGLGYYARARNLHRAAGVLMAAHNGQFPNRLDDVLALPGIGRSTAGAILAQAFGQRHAILDGNVKRVLCRVLGIQEWPGRPNVEAKLWAAAETLTPTTRLPDYTQAMMDLGATVCRRSRPSCLVCPVQTLCAASAKGQVAQIPVRRPKRVRPVRQTRMLVMTNAQAEVWLERRPDSGIWGGLWALPEIPDDERLNALLTRIGKTVPPPEPRPILRHGFTHFELLIEPLHLRVPDDAALGGVTECGEAQWCRIADVLNGVVGVPAAVTRLLSNLETPE